MKTITTLVCSFVLLAGSVSGLAQQAGSQTPNPASAPTATAPAPTVAQLQLQLAQKDLLIAQLSQQNAELKVGLTTAQMPEIIALRQQLNTAITNAQTAVTNAQTAVTAAQQTLDKKADTATPATTPAATPAPAVAPKKEIHHPFLKKG